MRPGEQLSLEPEVFQAGFRIAPELQKASLTEIRVGFRPVSKDGLPLLGRIPSVPGLVIATGLGPYRLTVGPLCRFAGPPIGGRKTSCPGHKRFRTCTSDL